MGSDEAADAGATDTTALARAGTAGAGGRADPDAAGRAAAEVTATGASSGEPAPLDDEGALRFDLLRNAAYHADRERFFDGLHRLTMFVVVVTGTAAFALTFRSDGWTRIIALVTATVGLVDLVFDVSGKARCHAGLRREAYRLLAEIEGGADFKKVRQRMVASYADEPPVNEAVNALAYNAANLAMGRDLRDLYKLGWPTRRLRHWLPGADGLRTYREIGEDPPVTARKGV